MLEERERGWGSNNLKLNICVVKKFVMSDEQNTGLRGIVIAGVIGLLGTALSSYLTGQSNIELKRQEFQSQLIMKAIEAKSVEERRNLLKFFIDAELINETEGLKKYTNPSEGEKLLDPPQVITSQGNFNRTDLDLFYCEGTQTTKIAQEQLDTIYNKLRNADFGQIVKGKIWTQDQEVSKEQLKNKVTVIVDDYEKGELRQMESLLSDFSLQVIDNPGKSTPWRISVVVCPIK
jgi:hypothetical protein